MSQLRKLITQNAGCLPFQLEHKIRDGQLRKAADKEVYMVVVAFKSHDLHIEGSADFSDKFLEPVLDTPDVEDLPPPVGAEQKRNSSHP